MRISNRPGDTGEADPAVTTALDAYGKGRGSEHAALTAVANSRLLVPVVAVLSEQNGDGTEKETEMALPTLVGNDGRTAVIAFTGLEAIRRWNPEARPVPFPAPAVWEHAVREGSAVVVDVGGPVPLVVEGARLAALAAGEAPPLPHEDPDVRVLIAAVTEDFDLRPGPPGTDFLLTLHAPDPRLAQEAMREIGARVQATGRFRQGVAFSLLSKQPLTLTTVVRASGPLSLGWVRGEPPLSFGTGKGSRVARTPVLSDSKVRPCFGG